MQITMFKGLFPVFLPDEWFSDPSKTKIRLGRLGDKQTIDFTPNGGLALAFWIDSSRESGEVRQHWRELDPAEMDLPDWTAGPWAIEPRSVVAAFGQSGTPLDLTHLG